MDAAEVAKRYFEQRLVFSVLKAEKPGFTLIPKEKLGENVNVHMSYSNLAEVYIQMDGFSIPLAEAIREGRLTVPELFAFARIDAQNGVCTEAYTSVHGLTHFTYTYPECELELAYDVYETPDGKQHLIEEICVYDISDNIQSRSHFYLDNESEWGYFMDREDWALTFDVTTVSPAQITVEYTHHQGQEIGTLYIENYMLFSSEDDDASAGTHRCLAKSEPDAEDFPISIQQYGSGQINIDWFNMVGSLEPGKYFLRFTVSDNYDEIDVHPLMVNYYDKQSYFIDFLIE